MIALGGADMLTNSTIRMQIVTAAIEFGPNVWIFSKSKHFFKSRTV